MNLPPSFHPADPASDLPATKAAVGPLHPASALLRDGRYSKDTAFSLAERRAFGLEGLLPPAVESLDQQVERVLNQLDHKTTDLERYIYLIGLEERNETVFYKTIMADPKRFMPLLYAPGVANACSHFSAIYRRPRGIYLNATMKGRMADVLRHWPEQDVRLICLTTGGRILGLGDLGVNGMAIAIGKLQLYTACAAVPPRHLLPILLDIGTTNTQLHQDPLYLGSRTMPLATAELDALTDELIQAVQQVFPACCIHFEDWKGTDAIRMLDRYQHQVLCFNDDIQGTAAVALAGIEAAFMITATPLRDQRILFLGAGAAGLGIAQLFCRQLRDQGLSEMEARRHVAFFDINGLISTARNDLSSTQALYVQSDQLGTDFIDVITSFRPTILIGVSSKSGAFNQQVIEAMSAINERPVIFALSNPTEKAECTAEQAYRWSKGQALYAAGVQFPDYNEQGCVYRPGQANNVYIYPAIGLAIYAARPRLLDDQAFIVAAHATAAQITDAQRAMGMLYPSQDDIIEVEVMTAVRICEYLFDSGLAQVKRPDNIRQWLDALRYRPDYE